MTQHTEDTIRDDFDEVADGAATRILMIAFFLFFLLDLINQVLWLSGAWSVKPTLTADQRSLSTAVALIWLAVLVGLLARPKVVKKIFAHWKFALAMLVAFKIVVVANTGGVDSPLQSIALTVSWPLAVAGAYACVAGGFFLGLALLVADLAAKGFNIDALNNSELLLRSFDPMLMAIVGITITSAARLPIVKVDRLLNRVEAVRASQDAKRSVNSPGQGEQKGFVTESGSFEFYALTPAENEVVALLFEALVPKQIALERNVSVHTVNDQIQSIRRKLNVKTNAEIASYRWR